MNDIKNEKMSFTADFSFQAGKPAFTGFSLETLISKKIKAKYRVLVRNPADGYFYTMIGMEEPLTQDEVNKVLEERYRGGIIASEFAFEVFNQEGKKIFTTAFNAADKTPADAFNPEKMVFTSFSWPFDLADSEKALLSHE